MLKVTLEGKQVKKVITAIRLLLLVICWDHIHLKLLNKH